MASLLLKNSIVDGLTDLTAPALQYVVKFNVKRMGFAFTILLYAKFITSAVVIVSRIIFYQGVIVANFKGID